MSRPKRGRGRKDHERPQWGGHADVAGKDGATGFQCTHCGSPVPLIAHGTSQRNHCPHCLWSLHVDVKPGDRSSLCNSPMEPIALWAAESGDVRIIHRCTGCGVLKPNRVAGDDSETAIAALVDGVVRAVGRGLQR